MKERPIIFSAPMVRAILEGRKTQTRRVVRPEPCARTVRFVPAITGEYHIEKWPVDLTVLGRGKSEMEGASIRCPYGAPGDVLWVKETWQYADWNEDGEPCIRYAADGAKSWRVVPEYYSDCAQHEWERLSQPENYNIDKCAADRRWRSSMFMPGWASRLTLGIDAVRVERLRDISEADAKAEGVPAQPIDSVPSEKYRNDFAHFWDHINAKRGHPWASNPWVWVVEFTAREAKR